MSPKPSFGDILATNVFLSSVYCVVERIAKTQRELVTCQIHETTTEEGLPCKNQTNQDSFTSKALAQSAHYHSPISAI